MKKVFALFFISIITLSLSAGQLGDFKDQVEEEKKRQNDPEYIREQQEQKERKKREDDDSQSLASIIFSESFKLLFIYNFSQRYARIPYEDIYPYNFHMGPWKREYLEDHGHTDILDAYAARRRWQLSGMIEYRHYREELYDVSVHVDFTFASIFKVKLGIDTFFEENSTFKDSINRTRYLFGLDLITWNNFALDFVSGGHYVGDVDTTFTTWGFSARAFPVKPVVFDWAYWHGTFGELTMQETAVRLGFVVDFAGIHEIGIGYNWTRLGNTPDINALTFHVRWWM